ncbi:DUF2905 domain-containing protein [Candidatus Formimonas warabiya]
MLIGFGVLLLIVGLILLGLGKLFHIGSLPGDIVYKKGNFTFYFPLVSCILLSIILTILLNFVFRK